MLHPIFLVLSSPIFVAHHKCGNQSRLHQEAICYGLTVFSFFFFILLSLRSRWMLQDQGRGQKVKSTRRDLSDCVYFPLPGFTSWLQCLLRIYLYLDIDLYGRKALARGFATKANGIGLQKYYVLGEARTHDLQISRSLIGSY
jgi:hypothetical protein